MYDELITKAGASVSPQDITILLKNVYENFPQIIENLSSRNDFPLEEGNRENLWNHIAEYCYRASLMDSTFIYLRLIAYEEWYKAMVKFDSEKRILQ